MSSSDCRGPNELFHAGWPGNRESDGRARGLLPVTPSSRIHFRRMSRVALLQLLLMPLSWRYRRRLLNAWLGYDIAATARIGLSLVIPVRRPAMGPGSYLGHFTLVRGTDELTMGQSAPMGHLDWITVFPAQIRAWRTSRGDGRRSYWMTRP